MKKPIVIIMLSVAAYALVFFGIMLCIVGVAMHIDRTSVQSSSGLPIALASFSFTVPGAVLLYLSRRMKRTNDLLAGLASIVKSYRRITVADLAARLGIPVHRALTLLSRAIAAGLVQGNFDRTTDEFFTSDSQEQRMELRYCASCGAPLDRVYLAGETVRCGRCGAVGA